MLFTRLFYKQLHLWVEPQVAKSLMQFEPQSCLISYYYFIISGKSCGNFGAKSGSCLALREVPALVSKLLYTWASVVA